MGSNFALSFWPTIRPSCPSCPSCPSVRPVRPSVRPSCPSVLSVRPVRPSVLSVRPVRPGSPGWVARVGRPGWVARPRLSLYLRLEEASQPRPTRNRQASKQAHTHTHTDTAPQANPLPHRTQGPKYAARHPLALIFKIALCLHTAKV